MRHVLPTIRVPTLVLHRTGDRCLLVEEGRYMAGLIPSARFVELPGDDHLPFVGDQDAMLDEIERFLAGTLARGESNQVLATILCTAIGGAEPAAAASDVERVQALVSAEAQVFNGRDVEQLRGRVFAAFDGPARAIRCGRRIADEGARLGVTLGLGLHTGECDRLRGAGEGPWPKPLSASPRSRDRARSWSHVRWWTSSPDRSCSSAIAAGTRLRQETKRGPSSPSGNGFLTRF